MKYRIFTYPVPCDEAVAELNAFLLSHRILRMRDEVVLKGSDSYLVFVVEYLDGLQPRDARRQLEQQREQRALRQREQEQPGQLEQHTGFRAVLPANTEKGTLASAYSGSRFAGQKENDPPGAGTERERPGRFFFVSQTDFAINIDLHIGGGEAVVYTCNCTEEYVRINY